MKQIKLILIIFIILSTNEANGAENPTNLSDSYPTFLNCSYIDQIPFLNYTAQKTICWMNIKTNQSMAAQICQNFQMKLFTIENAEMFLKYQFSVFHQFRNEDRDLFFNARLNGKILKTLTTPKVPVYNGYKWASKATDGCVAMVYSNQGEFKAKAVNCNSFLATFHCEFRWPETTTISTSTTKPTTSTSKKSKQPATKPTTTKTKTTPTTVTPTTQNPSNSIDLTACNYTEDLFYPDQSYIKSICWISDSYNQEAAAIFCSDRKMKLFTIGSSKIFDAYRQSIYLHFQRKNEERFFFNARAQNGELWTLTKPRIKVYNGYSWASMASTGCVVMIKMNTNDFMVQVVSCKTVKISFHCEYDSPMLCGKAEKMTTKNGVDGGGTGEKSTTEMVEEELAQ